MVDGEDWGELAKTVLMLEFLIGFLIVTGLVLHYGVFPSFEYIASLVDLSPYWKGVIDTLTFVILLGLFFKMMAVGPRRAL